MVTEEKTIHDLPGDVIREFILPRLLCSECLNFAVSSKQFLVFKKFPLERFLDRVIYKPQLHIFLKLSQFGIITGKMVIYGLNEYVINKGEQVYTVHLPSRRQFREAFRFLKSSPHITNVFSRYPFRYGGTNLNTFNEISVLEFVLSTRTTFILIYHKFKFPFDIIKKCALDYEQCGFYQGEIYRTQACVASHAARQIIKGFCFPNPDHLEQARQLGFKAYSIGQKSTEPKLNTGTSWTDERLIWEDEKIIRDSIESYTITPFQSCQIIPFEFESIQIVKLNISPVKSINKTLHFVDLNYKIHDTHFIVKKICIEICVLSLNPLTIAPTILNAKLDFTFSFGRIRPQLGKQIVEVSIDYNSDSCISHMFVTQLLDLSVLPTRFSDSLDVQLHYKHLN